MTSSVISRVDSSNPSAPVWWEEAICLRSSCKLNLFLNICGLRSDGYHELQTLFYPLAEPFDELYVRPSVGAGLKLICPKFPALENENTTLHKALDVFNQMCRQVRGQEFANLDMGFELFLHKQVPAGAGLGGGSANAAVFLKFLNKWWMSGHTMDKTPAWAPEQTLYRALNPPQRHVLSREKLFETAARVGADVPFFLMDGPALAEGIGERLSSVNVSLSGLYLVLVCPGIHVSTPWAYKEWDRLSLEGKMPRSVLQRYFHRLLTGDGLADKSSSIRWPWFYNNLEPAVLAAYREIATIKESLFRAGAKAALMSGSGSSVFGIFANREMADSAAVLAEFSGCRVLVQCLE